MTNIVVLTGAGISAESGLGTFRDKGGLWSQFNPAELATPQAYATNPKLVHEFYNLRRANCVSSVPNAAHFALARLERHHVGNVIIVTQNVDDLHRRAGSMNVLQMHGDLLQAKCAKCGSLWRAALAMSNEDLCPICGAKACRPDIVWFGESPYHMTAIRAAISDCDLFVVIGSSGSVYPAAGFATVARKLGVATLSINLEEPSSSAAFDRVIVGPATETVPRWVDNVLSITG